MESIAAPRSTGHARERVWEDVDTQAQEDSQQCHWDMRHNSPIFRGRPRRAALRRQPDVPSRRGRCAAASERKWAAVVGCLDLLCTKSSTMRSMDARMLYIGTLSEATNEVLHEVQTPFARFKRRSPHSTIEFNELF